MFGLAGNAQTYQYFDQSAEKGTALLVIILCICLVVVVGIVHYVTLDILNPMKDTLHVLYASMTQLQISIKLNVCNLGMHTLESVTYK